MSFFTGILSYNELRLFLDEIKCITFLKYDPEDVRTNPTYPIAYYKLKDENTSLPLIGSNKLVHVFYAPSYAASMYNGITNTLDAFNGENKEYAEYVVVFREFAGVSIYTNPNSYLNYRQYERGGQVKEDKKIKLLLEYMYNVDTWNRLISISFDAEDVAFNNRLHSLEENVRHQLVNENSPMPINKDIIGMIKEQSVILSNMWDSLDAIKAIIGNTEGSSKEVQSMNDIKRAKVEPSDKIMLVPVSGGDENVMYGSLSAAAHGQDDDSLKVEEEVEDKTVTEQKLAMLMDPLSNFIRIAMGSIGLTMLEAFITIPKIDGIKYASYQGIPSIKRYDEYFQTLTPVVRSAMSDADIWIRGLSEGRTWLTNVILSINPLTEPNVLKQGLLQACQRFVGVLIAKAKNSNPNRGMETRYTIPEHRMNENIIKKELRMLMTEIFNSQPQIKVTTTWPQFPTEYYTDPRGVLKVRNPLL